MQKSALLLFMLFSICCFSQDEKEIEDKNLFLTEFNYSHSIPMKDMGERFGRFNGIGGAIGMLFTNNIHVELKGDLLFGLRVKEDVLQQLRNDLGEITGADGASSPIFLRMRGAKIGLRLGKLFPIKKENRSGLKLSFGLGYLYHKIRLQDDSRGVSQIVGDYQYGYDRLTAGLNLEEFVGYQFVAKNQSVNLIVGIELFQAFTKGQRSFDFMQVGELTNENRLDLGVGLKAGFIIAFYQFDKSEEIFY